MIEWNELNYTNTNVMFAESLNFGQLDFMLINENGSRTDNWWNAVPFQGFRVFGLRMFQMDCVCSVKLSPKLKQTLFTH